VRATDRKTESEIRYEIDLLRLLKASKIPIAEPVKTSNNRDYFKWEEFWITAYQFMEGSHPRLSIPSAREVGKWMGRLHQIPLTPELVRPNSLNADYAKTVLENRPNIEAQFPGITQQVKSLSRLVSGEWSQAIIHGDIFPDNVIMNNRKIVAFVDVEDACTDSRLFDLGMGINGFCFLENHLDPNLLESFVTAYQKEYPLTTRESNSLPVFIDWTALILALWHLENAHTNENARSWKRACELWHRVLTNKKG